MKKLLTFIFLLFLVAVWATPVLAKNKTRSFIAHIGGGVGAMDRIAISNITDNDIAIVVTGGYAYIYAFDDAATNAEDAVDFEYIRPDDYGAGPGVWILQDYVANPSQNAGTDLTADLEEETHASEHNVGGADVIDRFTEGVTQFESTAGDTAPDITNGTTIIVRVVESNANGTITDFVDSGGAGVDGGDHSEFTTNDWFIFRMTDASTTIDFSGNAAIEGNAGTDYTGSATEIVDLIFRFQGTYWQCENLNSGFSDPLTMAAKVAMKVTTIAATPHAGTTTELWNGRYFVTVAAVINVAGVEESMEIVVVSNTDDNVDFNPDDADTITLNGTALAAGDSIRISDKGAIITCTGTGATTWSCSSDSGVDNN